MEKNTKIIIGAVFILLIAIFLPKFVDLTGNIVQWDFGDIGSEFSIKQQKCTDTDKGFNFGVQGVCFVYGKEVGRDSCSGNTIREWYCSDTGQITGGVVEDITGKPIVGWDLGLYTSGAKCYSKTYDCSKIGKGYKCGYGGVCAKLGK